MEEQLSVLEYKSSKLLAGSDMLIIEFTADWVYDVSKPYYSIKRRVLLPEQRASNKC